MKDSKNGIVVNALRKITQNYAAQLPQYEKMLGLVRCQEEELQKEEFDMGGLEKLLVQRQALMEDIDKSNREIQTLKSEVCQALSLQTFSVDAVRKTVESGDVEVLEQTVDRLGAILREIRVRDLQNEETLRARIRATAEELIALRHAKAANKAYQSAAKREGMFVDLSK